MKRRFLASIAAFAIVTFTGRAAVGGLTGYNWFADTTSVQLRGKTSTPSANGKFCSTLSGKLECTIMKTLGTRSPTNWKTTKTPAPIEPRSSRCVGTTSVAMLRRSPNLPKQSTI